MKKACSVADCDTCENGKLHTCQTCKDGYLLFLGQCFGCEFPCAVCAINNAAVMTNSIIPFFSSFQSTGAPTPPGTKPTDVDMFTIDLNNIPPEDVPWIMFGYFAYRLIDN